MATEVTLRKWGNSLGIVFPKELVKEKHLEPNEKIIINIVKEANLKDIFGSLKIKMSGQKFKDMARSGWE